MTTYLAVLGRIGGHFGKELNVYQMDLYGSKSKANQE